MRLRILDLNTPWFWLVAFAQRQYGEPRFRLEIYGPQRWSRFWLHCWKREEIPDARGQEPRRVVGARADSRSAATKGRRDAC